MNTTNTQRRAGANRALIKAALRILASCIVLQGGVFAQGEFTRVSEGDLAADSNSYVGSSWGDFNNDGLLDVFLSNYGGQNGFYQNAGNGVFKRIADSPAVQEVDTHTIPAWGDYDNDGWPDLLVPAGLQGAETSVPVLYRNNGDGTLVPVLAGDLGKEKGYFGGGWVDLDNDGFLDVLLSSTPPNSIGGFRYYRNNGDGTFTRRDAGPLTNDRSVNYGMLWADYDNDGRFDFYVVNSQPNQPGLLYHNDGGGQFTRVDGVAPATDRVPGNSNGGAWGDFDNDGFPDLFIASSGAAPNRLYHNTGRGQFTAVQNSPVLSRPPSAGSSTGAWGDFDNDGDLDLFVSNVDGHNQLFRNNGSGAFTEILSGPVVEDGGAGIFCSGSTWVDYDNDGALDLIVLCSTGVNLYHNDGGTNGWFEVKCVGAVSNRSAYGAKVRVRARIGGKTVWQTRELQRPAGYNTTSPVAHFGLGDAATVELLRVEWPSGTVQEMPNLSARQIVTVTEPPRLLARLGSEPDVELKGGRGMSYRVEVSTNLMTWSSVGNVTVTNAAGTSAINDPGAAGSPRRFYRAVLP